MDYKFVSAAEKPKTVTVITPTIGSTKLIDAMQSVADQTYQYVNHLVVVDGRRYREEVNTLCDRNPKLFNKMKVKVTTSPENTGADGFYGHRIYAAYPHLINSDYIFFLDEDNWYKPNHVESLVKILEEGNEFAYSLREIYDENKNYICDDNCESLGKWPIWFTHDNPQYLIDTSSFAYRRSFLIQTSQLWHSGWGGDRRYYSFVRESVKHDTSGLHTLCYRLDGNPNSVKSDFFEQGNEDSHKRYNGVFPWIKGE
jgi:glycosyltransferase involved in cell wall biosynthesis